MYSIIDLWQSVVLVVVTVEDNFAYHYNSLFSFRPALSRYQTTQTQSAANRPN